MTIPKPAFLSTSQRKHRPPLPFVRSKLPLATSRYCPDCYRERGVKVRRSRHYTLIGPIKRIHCNVELKERLPRIDYSHWFWNIPLIHWLFVPDEDADEWFESNVYTTCKHHGRELVHELSCIRKFSRFRRALIWIRARVIRSIELSMPI